MPIIKVMSTSKDRRRATAALPVMLLLMIVSSVGFLPAQSRRLTNLPPETDDVRRLHLDSAFAPLSQLAGFRSRIDVSRESGRRVLVTTESNPGYRYMLFVPEVLSLEEDAERFPIASAGTYILRRRLSDGKADQLKIFLHSDPGFFLRIRPDGASRTTLTLVVAGIRLSHEVPLPVSLETLLAEPFEHLMDMTSRRVDWSMIYPDTADPAYGDVALVSRRTRGALHTLSDADDGAMDEHGNLVLIDTLVAQEGQGGLNCSGFAKWVVDGMSLGLHGSLLPVAPLKTKHFDLRGHGWTEPLEETRDPYFGLDWTRNLATALLSAQRDGETVHPEAADVRSVAYHAYVRNVGYRVERLPLILYLLAVSEPGHFYLGSVSREFGDDPPLHQHVHVVVLFPYFDEEGRFVVDVMERNVETSLASLDRRYHSDSIHLVRIRANRAFAPPAIQH